MNLVKALVRKLKQNKAEAELKADSDAYIHTSAQAVRGFTNLFIQYINEVYDETDKHLLETAEGDESKTTAMKHYISLRRDVIMRMSYLMLLETSLPKFSMVRRALDNVEDGSDKYVDAYHKAIEDGYQFNVDVNTYREIIHATMNDREESNSMIKNMEDNSPVQCLYDEYIKDVIK